MHFRLFQFIVFNEFLLMPSRVEVSIPPASPSLSHSLSHSLSLSLLHLLLLFLTMWANSSDGLKLGICLPLAIYLFSTVFAFFGQIKTNLN